MRVVEGSVARPVTVTMAAVAVALFGWLGLRQLPLELLPEISHPTLTIRTDWPGAAPQEVESLVSRPLEQAVGAIPNLVRVSSVSAPERSEVTLEFDWGTRMEFAALDVREKVDLANLPVDAERPSLLRYDPSLEPVVVLALTWDEAAGPGSDAAELRLRQLAEDRVQRALEGLPGVAAVGVSGGLEQEFQVVVDPARLAAVGLTVADVAARLREENVNATGGAVESGDARFLVRTLNEFGDPEEALSVVLGTRDGVAVRLGDVALVERGARERRVMTRVDGRPSVQVSAFKEAEANVVAVADAVRERMTAVEQELAGIGLPVHATVVADQSRFVRAAIGEVRGAALWGGLLALLVLQVFLRRLSATVIIGLAIPVSILATFFAMTFTDTTLNVMSLGGLALGVGMLVDSAIVVLEAIEARRGDAGRRAAAVAGASEVGRAVVASTLTTICVFVPVLFVEGVAASLFRDMAVVVSVALLASLFASLTVIPMLSARGGGPGADGEADDDAGAGPTWASGPVRLARRAGRLAAWALAAPFAPFAALGSHGAGRVAALYEAVLRGALRHRLLVVTAAFLLAAAAALVAPSLGVDLLPEMSQGEVRVDLRLPVGTPLPTTARRVAAIESQALADPDVAAVAATIGQSLARPGLPAEEREHLAHLSVRLRDGVLGDAEDGVVARLERIVEATPALTARFERPALFSFAAPVEIELRGGDHRQLEDAARQLASALGRLPQLAAVTSGARGGNPELAVVFDRDRLADFGVTVAGAGQALRDQVLGAVATDLQRGERDVDLRVRASEDVRRDAARLADLPVALRDGLPVPLRAVAEIRVARGPAEIARRDHERVAVVTARPRASDLGGVLPAVRGVLDSVPLPDGVHAELSGKVAELGKSLQGMLLAIALATFLVYLVMASQFESFLQPFVILFSVPFAIVGALLTLWLLRLPLSVVAGIGFVMLAGIVVNNAIVLVDRINQHREAGLSGVEALVAAGRDRLRPILMTTATTVLGLLPMALSQDEGAELRVPLAVTVIGGLVLSTLLTLVLIPVLVSLTTGPKKGSDPFSDRKGV